MNLRQQDWSRLKPGAENSAWFSAMSGTHLVELSLPRYRPAGSWNQEQRQDMNPGTATWDATDPSGGVLAGRRNTCSSIQLNLSDVHLDLSAHFSYFPGKTCVKCVFFFSFKLCYLLERERMCPSCGSLPQMLQLPWSWELGTHVGSRNPVTWTITADSLSLQ